MRRVNQLRERAAGVAVLQDASHVERVLLSLQAVTETATIDMELLQLVEHSQTRDDQGGLPYSSRSSLLPEFQNWRLCVVLELLLDKRHKNIKYQAIPEAHHRGSSPDAVHRHCRHARRHRTGSAYRVQSRRCHLSEGGVVGAEIFHVYQQVPAQPSATLRPDRFGRRVLRSRLK